MAKRKHALKNFETEEEMDRYLEEHDLGLYFRESGKITQPHIKKVNLDLPEWLIRELDFEASRAGVSRQPLIKLWLLQKLEEERRKRGDKSRSF